MHHQVDIRRSLRGLGETTTQRARQFSASRIHINQFNPHARHSREQCGAQRAHHPGPNHRHPITDSWRGIPQPVNGGFQVGCKHRTFGRDTLWHRYQ